MTILWTRKTIACLSAVFISSTESAPFQRSSIPGLQGRISELSFGIPPLNKASCTDIKILIKGSKDKDEFHP
jgi:hypothetical protein